MTSEQKRKLAAIEAAAKQIDPETAEIKFEDVPWCDPYLLRGDQEDVKRCYFARSPGSDVWVHWEDLPCEVELRLWQKHKEQDPALRDPLSCWASFCNSRFFRPGLPDDETITENHVCYVRLICFGRLPDEIDQRTELPPLQQRQMS